MNSAYEAGEAGYIISTDTAKLNIGLIHHYLSRESYWAQGIPRAIVEKSITNSICFGIYKTGEQVGFARVVSDKATFAYLADVFVLPAYRGKGLSKFLMKTIHAHPDLQNLRRWWLGTKDAHGLYAQFGWTLINEDVAKRFMQLHNPDVYKNSSPQQE
ncbi:MAG TPA: GNAT family N-acetyltransferase [Panacibacter sp.]|nr:GNAT family N-acetyltransferase [Panacibacter sp.]HNP44696.1 GNAT family N-acetyltransferase [Panacibacter sp.]